MTMLQCLSSLLTSKLEQIITETLLLNHVSYRLPQTHPLHRFQPHWLCNIMWLLSSWAMILLHQSQLPQQLRASVNNNNNSKAPASPRCDLSYILLLHFFTVYESSKTTTMKSKCRSHQGATVSVYSTRTNTVL